MPEVAASTTISQDGKEYTFLIRPGFRFSDKTKLTARSFKRAIERLADPAMRSPAAFVAEYVQDIVGAGPGPERSDVEALRRGGEREQARHQAHAACPRFHPAAGDAVLLCGATGSPRQPGGRAGVRERRPLQRRRVRTRSPGDAPAEPSLPRKAAAPRRRLRGNLTSNGTEVIDRIEAGSADWGWISSPAWAARGRELVGKDALRSRMSRLRRRPSSDLSFFILNTRRGIFRDAHLRRAVNFAVNRRALVKLHGARPRKRDRSVHPAGDAGVQGRADLPVHPQGGQGRGSWRKVGSGTARSFSTRAPLRSALEWRRRR